MSWTSKKTFQASSCIPYANLGRGFMLLGQLVGRLQGNQESCLLQMIALLLSAPAGVGPAPGHSRCLALSAELVASTRNLEWQQQRKAILMATIY